MKTIQKIFYFSIGSLLTVIAAFWLGTSLASNNHPSNDTFPVYINSVSESDAQPQIDVAQAVQTIDLSGYNIAYLADESISNTDGLFAAARLFGQSARTFNSMAELAASHQIEPLDVLVIHGSAQGRVDRAWVAYMIRQGVVLVTINVPMSERTEWVNSNCDRQLVSRGVFNEVGNYAYVGVIFAMGANDADKTAMMEYQLNMSCIDGVEIPMLSDATFVGVSRTYVDMDAEDSVQRLQFAIRKQLWKREQAIYNYVNIQSPTPVPLFNVSGS